MKKAKKQTKPTLYLQLMRFPLPSDSTLYVGGDKLPLLLFRAKNKIKLIHEQELL
jgi:hypothetical protein